MQIPFVGPAYEDSATAFDNQRCINQFLVRSGSGESKTKKKLTRTPGLGLYSQSPTVSRTRGWIKAQDRAFFIIGQNLCEVDDAGNMTQYTGIILTDVGFVSLATNFSQICIVDGNNGYIFQLQAYPNTLIDPTFQTSGDWTEGSGWTVSSGTATASGAISTALSTTPQNASGLLTTNPGIPYTVTYTVATRTAGSVTVSVGGAAGTPRSSAGTYTEVIIAGSSNQTLSFTGTGFSGTLNTLVSMTIAANTLYKISDDYFLGASSVSFLDQYFIFTEPNSGTYYISALGDGQVGDPTQFANAEANPDNIVGGVVFHEEFWALGEDSIEPIYDSGNLAFPLTPIQGAIIEYGCASPGSITKTANTIFWLGQDEEGGLIVWMSNNSVPQRVSNYGVEFALSQMTNPNDCTSYTYEDSGHYFLVMNFTTDSQTWVYDITEQSWHERLAWNQMTGEYERHWSEGHVYCFGLHLVGDYQTGNIYILSNNFFDDNGTVIRRERISQYITDDLEYMYVDEFQLDMRAGVGITSGAAEDVNPMIHLSWSNDGGNTFTKGRYLPVGKAGQFETRVITRMCGRFRQRVWKTVYTARTEYDIIAAHANPEKGLN